MNTVWLSVALCWGQWQVRAWPSEDAALAHRDGLVADGLQSGMDAFEVVVLGTESPLPSEWPALPASLFDDGEASELSIEMSRKLPYIVTAASVQAGRLTGGA